MVRRSILVRAALAPLADPSRSVRAGSSNLLRHPVAPSALRREPLRSSVRGAELACFSEDTLQAAGVLSFAPRSRSMSGVLGSALCQERRRAPFGRRADTDGLSITTRIQRTLAPYQRLCWPCRSAPSMVSLAGSQGVADSRVRYAPGRKRFGGATFNRDFEAPGGRAQSGVLAGWSRPLYSPTSEVAEGLLR